MTVNDFLAVMARAQEWVAEGNGNRCVHIKLGEPGDGQFVQIWAYSYTHMQGRFVHRPEDFDTFEDYVRQQLEIQLRELSSRLASVRGQGASA